MTCCFMQSVRSGTLQLAAMLLSHMVPLSPELVDCYVGGANCAHVWGLFTV